MQRTIPWRCACIFTALFGATDALRATRRQCCNFVAATAALAADRACAVDDGNALDGNALEDAFSARTKVLRPLQSGTCDAPTPEWLRGDWTVAASRFEGVSFPQSGSYYPRGGFTQTIAGARRGTILAQRRRQTTHAIAASMA